jgi:hypothetical protein
MIGQTEKMNTAPLFADSDVGLGLKGRAGPVGVFDSTPGASDSHLYGIAVSPEIFESDSDSIKVVGMGRENQHPQVDRQREISNFKECLRGAPRDDSLEGIVIFCGSRSQCQAQSPTIITDCADRKFDETGGRAGD